MSRKEKKNTPYSPPQPQLRLMCLWYWWMTLWIINMICFVLLSLNVCSLFQLFSHSEYLLQVNLRLYNWRVSSWCWVGEACWQILIEKGKCYQYSYYFCIISLFVSLTMFWSVDSPSIFRHVSCLPVIIKWAFLPPPTDQCKLPCCLNRKHFFKLSKMSLHKWDGKWREKFKDYWIWYAPKKN